jgi:inhibitor of KinA
MPTPLFKIYPISEQALTIQLGEVIDDETRLKVLSVFQSLQKEKPDYFLDIIPAYADVTIVYDLNLKKHHASAFEFVKGELLKQLDNKLLNSQTEHSRHLKVPVCYESEFAMDARLVSQNCNLPFDRMVELHTAGVYEVFMIGFLPGFAYMGPLDQQLETPRLSVPRKRVPGGSVGIAGLQTGIYPMDSPGGWNIIGRSPLLFFDTHRNEPSLFQHGDRVSFVPISRIEFKNSVDYPNHRFL